MSKVDRILQKFGMVRADRHRRMMSVFQASAVNRFTADWATSVLSSDQELRANLRPMRARSRQLVNNNDYAKKFLNELKKNVIGSTGITLQARLEPQDDPQIARINDAIEKAWTDYGEYGNCTAEGEMSLTEAACLWIQTVAGDGECFTRKVKNFPHNRYGFAIEFIDSDCVDETLMRLRQANGQGGYTNSIVMGVELGEWRRRVAYHVRDGHPSELAGAKLQRIAAEEIEHAVVFGRVNQTRGIPFMHTAMSKMNMLSGYEYTEAVAARVAAAKMGFFTSKTGEEYTGGTKDEKTGKIITDVAPGTFEQLPEGVDFKLFDPQHPNAAFGEFIKAMVRGMSVGLDVAYSSLSGDLRDVNFSSIRQGVLQEREAYKLLQTFAINRFYKPIFKAWFAMALAKGALDLPAGAPSDPDVYFASMNWQGRGWSWVDPYKDVQTEIAGIKAGVNNLQLACAKMGLDWRDVIKQRAIENKFALEQGVTLDFSGLRVEDPAAAAEEQNATKGE